MAQAGVDGGVWRGSALRSMHASEWEDGPHSSRGTWSTRAGEALTWWHKVRKMGEGGSEKAKSFLESSHRKNLHGVWGCA